MIEVNKAMVDRLAHEIRTWLAGWQTPGDFSDYVEEDRASVALEILVDCHWGIHITRRAAELLDIALTEEDLQYDDGMEALEESTNKLAEQIQAELDKLDLPGYVYFGYMEHTGDYALQWGIEVDDLPYPPC